MELDEREENGIKRFNLTSASITLLNVSEHDTLTLCLLASSQRTWQQRKSAYFQGSSHWLRVVLRDWVLKPTTWPHEACTRSNPSSYVSYTLKISLAISKCNIFLLLNKTADVRRSVACEQQLK